MIHTALYTAHLIFTASCTAHTAERKTARTLLLCGFASATIQHSTAEYWFKSLHPHQNPRTFVRGFFCFSDLFGMTSIVPRTVGADSVSARGALPLLQTSRVDDKHCPLRCCRRDALCSREMYVVKIHLSRTQKHFLQFFSALHRPELTVFDGTTAVLLLQSARDAL